MNINRRVTHQDLSWFIDLYNQERLVLDPPYQRKSVWTRVDKLFFLNTILNNFPCPAIYLQKEIDDNFNTIYNVVDGKQRLTTILDFHAGKLRITKSGNSDLDDKKWSQIENREIKNQFMNYLFTVEILDDNTTQWNEVFDRLNRNSKTLSRQELRHARYEGWFIKMAEKEADESRFWGDIGVSTTGRMKRMKDVEFISILLLVILEEKIVGFPQDNLDELYAKYDYFDEMDEDRVDEMNEDRVDKEDSFNSKFNSVKEFITNANAFHNTFTTNKTFTKKRMTHLYTIWTYLVLIEIPNKSDEFAEKIHDFMTILARIEKSDDLEEGSCSDKERVVLTYHKNAIGAATELKQREARMNALDDFLKF